MFTPDIDATPEKSVTGPGRLASKETGRRGQLRQVVADGGILCHRSRKLEIVIIGETQAVPDPEERGLFL